MIAVEIGMIEKYHLKFRDYIQKISKKYTIPRIF